MSHATLFDGRLSVSRPNAKEPGGRLSANSPGPKAHTTERFASSGSCWLAYPDYRVYKYYGTHRPAINPRAAGHYSPRHWEERCRVQAKAMQRTSQGDAEYKRERCRVQVEQSFAKLNICCVCYDFSDRQYFFISCPSCSHIQIHLHLHVFAMTRPPMSTRRAAGIAQLSTRAIRALHGAGFRDSLQQASLTLRCHRDESRRAAHAASA